MTLILLQGSRFASLTFFRFKNLFFTLMASRSSRIVRKVTFMRRLLFAKNANYSSCRGRSIFGNLLKSKSRIVFRLFSTGKKLSPLQALILQTNLSYAGIHLIKDHSGRMGWATFSVWVKWKRLIDLTSIKIRPCQNIQTPTGPFVFVHDHHSGRYVSKTTWKPVACHTLTTSPWVLYGCLRVLK